MFGHNDSDDSRPTLMQTAPGFTSKRFCRNPLGSEGELTSGPDEANPYRSATEREVVEEHREKERQQRTGDVQLFKTGTKDAEDTGGVSHPLHTNSTDDTGAVDLPGFELPAFENISPFNSDGPQF